MIEAEKIYEMKSELMKLNVQYQGGEGEVVGQLSCIYETITTKILKKLKKFFI